MLMRKHKVSERRACRLVGQHRSSNRYRPSPSDFEEKLVVRMTELADEHPKWGYRMICGLLVAEGWPVNKKRIERLWRREGLQVPAGREDVAVVSGAVEQPDPQAVILVQPPECVIHLAAERAVDRVDRLAGHRDLDHRALHGDLQLRSTHPLPPVPWAISLISMAFRA